MSCRPCLVGWGWGWGWSWGLAPHAAVGNENPNASQPDGNAAAAWLPHPLRPLQVWTWLALWRSDVAGILDLVQPPSRA